MTEKSIRKSGVQVVDSFYDDPNALDHDKDTQRVESKNPDAIVLIGFTESTRILSSMIKNGLGSRSKRVHGPHMNDTLAGRVNPRDPGALAGLKGTSADAGDEVFVKRLREATVLLRFGGITAL